MADRDARHRKAAQRLRTLAVDLGAEVVARGGSLDYYPELTAEEVVEAQAKSRGFFRRRFLEVQANLRDHGPRTSRMDRPTSTGLSQLDG